MDLILDAVPEGRKAPVNVTVLRLTKTEEFTPSVRKRLFNILKKGIYTRKVGNHVNLGVVAFALARKFELPLVHVSLRSWRPDLYLRSVNIPDKNIFLRDILTTIKPLILMHEVFNIMPSIYRDCVMEAISEGRSKGKYPPREEADLFMNFSTDRDSKYWAAMQNVPNKYKLMEEIAVHAHDVLCSRVLFHMKSIVDKQKLAEVFNII